MSNTPAPARPWFRLASMARPAPQAPTPTPEPTPAPPSRPTPVRPAFREAPPPAGGVSSVPTSPVAVGRGSQASSPVPPGATTFSSVAISPVKTVPTAAAAPTTTTTSSLVPTSPAKPLETTSSAVTSPLKTAVTTTNRAPPSPKEPIKTVKPAAPRSPPTAPPPSPLTTLPPPQVEPMIPLEAEQKRVVVQKTINEKPKGTSRRFNSPQKEKGNNGKKSSSETDQNRGMKVITIAGENRGAFMELIRSPHQKNGFHHGSPHRLGKMVNSSRTGASDGGGSDYQSYSSGGEDGKKKEKSNTIGSKTKPMNAFMNSNVQGVNNSIVYNSSCTHHDPGLHLSLHRKPTTNVKERTNNGYNS